MVKESKMSAPKQTSKKMTHDQAFNLGWNLEQKLADNICEKLNDDDIEGIDTAFIAAFQGMISRLSNFYPKEALLEIVSDVADMERNENFEHNVCNDCQEKIEDGEELVSEEKRNKMH